MGTEPNDCVISNRSREANQVFPLWVFGADNARRENLSTTFRAYIDERYENHYTAEEIFGYIYAVLHASTFRVRYAEFLRIDFPRVPFPEEADEFEALSELGWALVQAHLLKELPRLGLASYSGSGDHVVSSIRYVPKDLCVAINASQVFKPIPQAVWDFKVGSYPVIAQYLKARKDRRLSLGEINRVAEIAESVAFTIEQMTRIESAYLAAFPKQQI